VSNSMMDQDTSMPSMRLGVDASRSNMGMGVDASGSNMELVAIASRPNVGLDLDASMPNQVRLRACPDPRWVVFGSWTDPSGQRRCLGPGG
jgi:hypothetical protein